MPYNPYDCQRYLDTINLMAPSSALPPPSPSKTDLSYEEYDSALRHQQRAAELERRVWYEGGGFAHSSRRRAWEGIARGEEVLGRYPCQNMLDNERDG